MGASPISRYNFDMTSMTVVFAGPADVYPHAAIGSTAGASTRAGAPKVASR
jgi:hypothetical protein